MIAAFLLFSSIAAVYGQQQLRGHSVLAIDALIAGVINRQHSEGLGHLQLQESREIFSASTHFMGHSHMDLFI